MGIRDSKERESESWAPGSRAWAGDSDICALWKSWSQEKRMREAGWGKGKTEAGGSLGWDLVSA